MVTHFKFAPSIPAVSSNSADFGSTVEPANPIAQVAPIELATSISVVSANGDSTDANDPMVGFFDEAQQLERTIEQFEHYASFGSCSPQPSRDGGHFEGMDYPYCGDYGDSSLTPESENRMRQGFDLQVWLALDARRLMEPMTTKAVLSDTDAAYLSANLTSMLLENFRAVLQKKRDALTMFQGIQLDRLAKHVTLSQALFQRLALEVPTDNCTTPVPPECLALMVKANVEMPETMNPLGLYKALSRRLLVQEREVVSVGLELLRDELQLVRMGFYHEAGQFLKVQAQTILAEYEFTEHASSLDKEDDIYQTLQAVTEDPFNTLWPAPIQPDVPDFMSRPDVTGPMMNTPFEETHHV